MARERGSRGGPAIEEWVGLWEGERREIAGATWGVLRYASIMNRITIDPEQCGGRPCIRGIPIRVTDVLDLPGNGLTAEQVLHELPDLEAEVVQACLQYASRKLKP